MDWEVLLEDLGIEIRQVSDQWIKGKCPWKDHEHDANKPGFCVRVDSGYYTCFKGCGQGSFDKLVQRILEVTEQEAHHWLLLRGGEVTSDALMKCLDEPEPKKASIAIRVFQEDYDRQVADRTSSYILDRGFTMRTLKAWGFRYDPTIPAIVIPMYDISGQHLVGVIRREAVKDAQPNKYMYSPDCKKSNHLFGANMHPRTTGQIIVVEGPLDAVWLHQCGIPSAVAVMGAYCSQTQQKLMTQLGTKVILAVDADESGRAMAVRLREQLSPWFAVTQVKFPTGCKDVQELSYDQVHKVFQV